MGKGIQVEKVLRDLGMPIMGETNGNYKLKCPWPENHMHGDRNPSFYVKASDGAWLCHKGCGQGGGRIQKLVSLVLGIPEGAAEAFVLERSDLSVDMGDVLAALPSAAKKDQAQAPSESYRLDYERQVSDRTSSYILKRGFTKETLASWGFRYDPVMKAIVIPVFDVTGERLVGIIRRFVPPVPQGYGKYFNSPGMDKGMHLFGAHKHPRDTGTVILVEGPLDTVWLHQCGYESAVGMMGVDLSDQQMALIAKLGGTVVLALDNDDAGRDNADVVERRLSRRFQVRRVKVTGGKDVQELGKEDLARVFGKPTARWERP